jgi:hypothetical protein
MADNDIFRGVWQIRLRTNDPTKQIKTIYGKPYTTVGPAKAQVTRVRNHSREIFIDGWVERPVSWEAIE